MVTHRPGGRRRKKNGKGCETIRDDIQSRTPRPLNSWFIDQSDPIHPNEQLSTPVIDVRSSQNSIFFYFLGHWSHQVCVNNRYLSTTLLCPAGQPPHADTVTLWPASNLISLGDGQPIPGRKKKEVFLTGCWVNDILGPRRHGLTNFTTLSLYSWKIRRFLRLVQDSDKNPIFFSDSWTEIKPSRTILSRFLFEEKPPSSLLIDNNKCWSHRRVGGKELKSLIAIQYRLKTQSIILLDHKAKVVVVSWRK